MTISIALIILASAAAGALIALAFFAEYFVEHYGDYIKKRRESGLSSFFDWMGCGK